MLVYIYIYIYICVCVCVCEVVCMCVYALFGNETDSHTHKNMYDSFGNQICFLDRYAWFVVYIHI